MHPRPDSSCARIDLLCFVPAIHLCRHDGRNVVQQLSAGHGNRPRRVRSNEH